MRQACFALGLWAFGIGTAAGDALTSAQIEQIDRLLTGYMTTQSVPGLSVALVIDGEPAWSMAYGVADLENNVPVTELTAFRTASIGKTMTATAAMQLVEQGKLDLDANIRSYCAAFPRKPQSIVVRHLISHLSGIRHYGGPREREEESSTRHYSNVIEAMEPFKNDELLFPPGTQFLYSTYGYDVLGCVIEGAAGVPFLQYMAEHVWTPAGMKATRDDDPAALIPNRAAGYRLVDGKLRNAEMVDMSNRMPAGGYITTVIDLARFAAAVLDGRLVQDETFRRMTVPVVLPNGEKVAYGLGWGLELEEWHSDTWAYHGGSSPGASGIIALMPRHRFGVAILTNLEDLPGRSDLAADVARVALGFDAGQNAIPPQ